MILFKNSDQLGQYISHVQSNGRKTALIPTMGALHAGHLSLVDAGKKSGYLTICSIFVNPTQFNDPKDFEKYPITIEKDIYKLEKEGTDILFLPTIDQVYPQGFPRNEKYDLGQLEKVFEGQFRPGHFQGVCQVMFRLLSIIEPDHLFMGQKDYQQCMVIKWLINFMKSKTVFHGCPTVREPDGLAMSSRNVRLNEEQRKRATTIFESLSYLKNNLSKGNLSALLDKARSILTARGFKIDYLDIADADNLERVGIWDGRQKLVALAAAFLDEIRLIDNIVLN
ncbi:MAG: pantoate--beta-alanine ligase [Bacteroidetes bacterium]|nr:MAG: pantoate--beta-alanine ligase [Bacteroidota bacterium]